MAVQEGAGTGKVSGTAGEEEEEVAVVVEVEEVGVVGWVQVVGTLQGHLERGVPVVGWETFPSEPASPLWSKQAGSWDQMQEGVEEEEEGEEMQIH